MSKQVKLFRKPEDVKFGTTTDGVWYKMTVDTCPQCGRKTVPQKEEGKEQVCLNSKCGWKENK